MFKDRKFVLAAFSMLLSSTALFAATTTPNVTFSTGGASQPAITTINSPSAEAPQAPVDMKKVSEAFGHFIGRHLKSPTVTFDLESVIKGIREGVEGKPAPMTDKEYEQAMMNVQKASHEKLSKENLSAAEAYLKNNANTAGFVVVEPGKLYYKVVKAGTGPVVEEHGTPQINYSGKFIDGTVFGSSENSGGPIAIPLDQTIAGFSKAIVGMKEGEKRTILVHPDLGYGTTGHLPPNSLLIFDVEVVKAKAPDLDSDDDDDDDDDDDYDDDEDEDDDVRAKSPDLSKKQNRNDDSEY